jgi:hypothetical protein
MATRPPPKIPATMAMRVNSFTLAGPLPRDSERKGVPRHLLCPRHQAFKIPPGLQEWTVSDSES